MTLDEIRRELAERGEVRLKVKVTPRSGRSEVAGLLADGTLKARVQAPPEKGKANEELRALLARELGVRTSPGERYQRRDFAPENGAGKIIGA